MMFLLKGVEYLTSPIVILTLFGFANWEDEMLYSLGFYNESPSIKYSNGMLTVSKSKRIS